MAWPIEKTVMKKCHCKESCHPQSRPQACKGDKRQKVTKSSDPLQIDSVWSSAEYNSITTNATSMVFFSIIKSFAFFKRRRFYGLMAITRNVRLLLEIHSSWVVLFCVLAAKTTIIEYWLLKKLRHIAKGSAGPRVACQMLLRGHYIYLVFFIRKSTDWFSWK